MANLFLTVRPCKIKTLKTMKMHLHYHNVDLEKAKLHQSEADLVLQLSTLTASLLVKVELICKFSAFMNSCIICRIVKSNYD